MMDINSTEWLSKLLEKCYSFDFEDPESENVVLEVVEIVKERYKDGQRHRYSAIAKLIRNKTFMNLTSDTLDMVVSNLNYISVHANELGLPEKEKGHYDKLVDHVSLEIDRCINVDRKLDQYEDEVGRFKSVMDVLQNIDEGEGANILKNVGDFTLKQEKRYSELEQKLVKTEEEYSGKTMDLDAKVLKVEEQLKGFNSQSITVLSIFTAIVFAFTGGFTMLGSAFGNLSQITKNESLLLIILVMIVGGVLFNVVYFLIYFIGIISTPKIYVGCGCSRNCEACKNKKGEKRTCSWLLKLIRHHPVITSINAILAIALVVLLILNMSVFANGFYKYQKEEGFIADQDMIVETQIPVATVTPEVTTENITPTSTIPTATEDIKDIRETTSEQKKAGLERAGL